MCMLPAFFVLSKSLCFTPNPGPYTPIYPFSPPNALLFTPHFYSVLVPVCAVPSGYWGWGGVREFCCAKLG